MYCKYCGSDRLEDGVCKKCGRETLPAGDKSIINETISEIVKGGNFLTICILLTVSAGFSLLTEAQIKIFTTLLAIFGWVAISRCKKGTDFQGQIKAFAVIENIQYVINYVVYAISLPVLAICLVGRDFVLGQLKQNLAAMSPQLEQYFGEGISRTQYTLSILTLIVTCAAGLIINAIGRKKLVGFLFAAAENVHRTEKPQTDIKNLAAWTIVLGVAEVVFSLSGTITAASMISVGCSAAAYILAGVIVKNNM